MSYRNQAKRQLSVEMLWEDERKKLRLFESSESFLQSLISCLEDVSNEIICEIFDYLDTREIFEAFINLNQRFQNFLLHSHLPLKMQNSQASKQSFELLCQQMIIPNKHRMLSLYLSNRLESIHFFTLNILDSSFYRLESLILHEIQYNEILTILPSLTHLPQLFSLTISLDNVLNDIKEIYSLIFRLPMLKYNKLSGEKLYQADFIPIVINEQSSSIECLVINYDCRLQELYAILSCTPKLRRLTCLNLFDNKGDLSSPLFYLKYLSIGHCHLEFDVFENLIQNLSSQLEVLYFSSKLNINYLDENQWESLITKYMPNLHVFQYKFVDTISNRSSWQPYPSFLTLFTSAFWLRKGWSLNIQIDLFRFNYYEIIYSIQSNKSHHPISQLTLQCCQWKTNTDLLTDYLQFLSSISKITSIQIEFECFAIDVLLHFIHLFPDLDLLTIKFMNLNPIQELTNEQISQIYFLAEDNKITKVKIEQMVDLNRIEILLDLCSQMEDLQIPCRNYSELESILRLILTKKNLRYHHYVFLFL